MSPFKRTADLTDDDVTRLYTALRTTLRDAVDRSSGVEAGKLKAEKKTGMRVHGRTGEALPGLRGHHPGGLLQRLLAPVLPHLPDGRQAAGRPQTVEVPQVAAGPHS